MDMLCGEIRFGYGVAELGRGATRWDREALRRTLGSCCSDGGLLRGHWGCEVSDVYDCAGMRAE